MPVDFAKLDRAFNPRCVAVVGDKDKFDWITAEMTFKGPLYSVQISPTSIKAIEAMGVKNYTSLPDIPEPVDLAVVAVPRSAAMQIMEDCIRKGVAAAHFFTSGFSETDTEEGRKLEGLLAARAKEADFYLVGPNCMGLFNPATGIRQNAAQYTGVAGPVGLISQSGTHAVMFSREGHFQGVDISKSVSFGNGIVLDSADFLEYLGQDTGTKIICMYLEGVKDGRRFLSVLRRVAAKKPVIIWKGGRTSAGERAIASHTGSLAVANGVWQAAVRQYGATSVSSMEELIDTVKALLYLSPVKGTHVGVVGGSGGQSVAISDAFLEARLDLPTLTEESYRKLSTFFSLIGASYRNPVDTGAVNRKDLKQILDILADDPNIDNVVMFLSFNAMYGRRPYFEVESDVNLMIDLKKRTKKPVFVIIAYYSYSPDEIEETSSATSRLLEAGVPAFVTIERGARAIRNAYDYYRSRGP